MSGGKGIPPQEGRVVYIHPKRRFYTVEFTYSLHGVTRSFRQSFPLRGRIVSGGADGAPERLDDRPHRPRGATSQVERRPTRDDYPLEPRRRNRRKK
mgnify:CR=1 FL=1